MPLRFADLPDGTFVWSRTSDGRYRLGRIVGSWRYDGGRGLKCGPTDGCLRPASRQPTDTARRGPGLNSLEHRWLLNGRALTVQHSV
jgi:hypothetical protein